MAQNTSIINLVGNVANPVSTSQPDSSSPLLTAGRQGELVATEIHGKFFIAAYRRNVFKFNVTAKTLPVVASGLVSVFTLWNPPSSGVIAEMISLDIGVVVAATIVDTIGWYFSSGTTALAGTFTTPSVANTNHFSARVGDTPGNLVAPYTAYTHSGTPVRCDIVGSFAATTDTTANDIHKDYDGRMLLPPGVAISLAASTAAAGTVGSDPEVIWSEWIL